MAMFKSPVLLLLLTLFLSSAFLSLGFHLRSPRNEFSGLVASTNPQSPRREYKQCQQRCQEEEQGQRRQRQCQQQCEQRMREREQEEEEEEEEDDPRQQYEQCQQRCQRKQQGRREQQQCRQRCQREYEEQQQEEEDNRRINPQEPRQQYQQCKQRCQRQHQGQRKQQQCQRTCREQFEEQQQESGGDESEKEQQCDNPFLIRSQKFQSRFRSEQGHLRVLPRFSQRYPLPRALENYGISLLQANPNTFVLPHHCDSEALYVVLRGQGTITFVNDEGRQSFKLKCGNALRVPPGTTVYLVNPERNEKLIIAAFKESVNAPGHLEEFFPAGGDKPQAYYQVFSSKFLEAIFNAPRDQIKKLFRGQTQEGMMRRASQEQLKALSEKDSSSSRHSESEFLIDLTNERPKYSNEHGRFYEACPHEFKQLRNMDVSVSAVQMNKESIFLPHINSRQTTVVLITEGSGEFQMACPHLSKQSKEEQGEEQEEEQEQRSGRYEKVTARVNAGDIFVVPADHPVALISSSSENLKAIGFGINAENNKRIFLAGQNNVVKNMEEEAQELSFGVPARLVQQVFNNQEQSHFASLTQRRQQSEEEDNRGNRLSSILDIARLF